MFEDWILRYNKNLPFFISRIECMRACVRASMHACVHACARPSFPLPEQRMYMYIYYIRSKDWRWELWWTVNVDAFIGATVDGRPSIASMSTD